MLSPRVAPEALRAAISATLQRYNCAADVADLVAANLVDADLCGHGSHGSRLLPLYLERLRTGAISATARPVTDTVAGPVAHVDGRLCFGQLAGIASVKQGVALAREHGVGVVALRRSGHLGRNGMWAERAAAEGCLSLHFINSPSGRATIIGPGATEPALMSSPIAFGAPGADDPLTLDFAIGEISVNSVKLANERGETLPSDCIIADDGTLTNDPAVFMQSARPAIAAFGGHKGFGLGVFANLLAGLAGGGTYSGDATGTPSNNMLSIYLDPGAFTTGNDYRRDASVLAEWLTATDSHLPGARSASRRVANADRDIEVDALTLVELFGPGGAPIAADQSLAWPPS